MIIEVDQPKKPSSTYFAIETSTGTIPTIVNYLIKRFAKKPGGIPVVTWMLSNINEFNKRVARQDRISVDDVRAWYGYDDADHNNITINLHYVNDIDSLIDVVLHEIAHYNQRMGWIYDDVFREKFARLGGLPPHMDLNYDLYDLDYDVLMRYWEKKYGYNNAPHEIDARKFAEKHKYKVSVAIRMLIAQYQVSQETK